jgi:MFS family permease
MEPSVDAEVEAVTPLTSSEPPLSSSAVGPPVSFSKLRLWGFSCLWLGVSAYLASMSVLMVAERVEKMVGPDDKSFVTGLVLSLSGLAAGVVFPVVGAYSDTLSSRWGRRTPFMFWGTLFTLVSTVPFALGGYFLSLAPFVIGTVLINMGTSIISAPFGAVIPDLVSSSQVGVASGFMGVQTLLGYAIGSGVIGLIKAPLESAFGTAFVPECVLLCVLLVATLSVTVVAVKEKPHFHAPSAGDISLFSGTGWRRAFFPNVWLKLVGIWKGFFAPFSSRDFFWVFLTKFMYTCGIVSTSNFLFYWVQDVFEGPPYSVMGLFSLSTPDAAVSMFLLPLLLGSTVSSLVAGILSDRFGRKLMVYIAGALQATAATVMVIYPKMDIVLILGLIFGLGHGAFLSVDFALAVDALPCEKTAAKDLGVWHISTTLGNVVAPFATGFLLYYFKAIGVQHYGNPRLGYTIIFSMACVLFLTSALLVSRVKVGGRKPIVVAAAAEEVGLTEMSSVTSIATTSSDEQSTNKEE